MVRSSPEALQHVGAISRVSLGERGRLRQRLEGVPIEDRVAVLTAVQATFLQHPTTLEVDGSAAEREDDIVVSVRHRVDEWAVSLDKRTDPRVVSDVGCVQLSHDPGSHSLLAPFPWNRQQRPRGPERTDDAKGEYRPACELLHGDAGVLPGSPIDTPPLYPGVGGRSQRVLLLGLQHPYGIYRGRGSRGCQTRHA